MPSATPPSAAQIAEAAKHGSQFVVVKVPHGVTFGLGNGNYSFNVGDYVLVPNYAVPQLRLDGMIV